MATTVFNKRMQLRHIAWLVMHLFSVKTDTGIKVWEYLFTTKSGEGWLNGSAGITGVLLFIVFAVMGLTSLPCVRRRGYFEV